MELVANFTLNNEALDAQFDISEEQNFDALFQIYATPTKVSQLENDLNYQTDMQVQESIETALVPVNESITDINNRMIDTVIGDDLIGVTRQDNTVTLNSQTFVFEQGIPSTEWVINHNLNKRPSVQLTYSNGQRFEAYREYINNNQIIIKLDAAATGFAYLN